MKPTLLFFAIVLCTSAFAQNVGINLSSPASVLDVKSTSTDMNAHSLMVRNNNNDTLFKLKNDGVATIGSVQKDFGQLRIISNTKMGHSNLFLTGTNVLNAGVHFSDLVFDGTNSGRYWRMVSRVFGSGSEFNHSVNNSFTIHTDSLLNALSILGDGKVGLNTATPKGYLEIRNDAMDQAEVVPHLNLVGTGLANRSYIYFNTADGSHRWSMRAQYNNGFGNFLIAADDDTKFAISEDGKMQLGAAGGISRGQVNIPFNSSTTAPHFLCYETEDDYSRIMLMNGNSITNNWQIAGYVGATNASSRLNFYNNIAGDVLSMSGDGRVAIGGDVLGGANNSKLLIRQNAAQYALAFESGVNGNRWDWQLNGSNDLQLYYNGVSRGSFNNVTGTYTAVSDRRLKKDVLIMPKAMEEMLQLKAYQYHYNDNNSNDPFSYGFMAQDVQKIFPDAVRTIDRNDGTKVLGINYQFFTVLAVKGLQEQQERINSLEERLLKLEQLLINNNHK